MSEGKSSSGGGAYQGMSPATFMGADAGLWRVESITARIGATLPEAKFVDVRPGVSADVSAAWALRGVAGHARYVESGEKPVLDARSPKLGRAPDLCAALIPIRKSAAWWALPQDERRAIFERRSRHISDSLPFLPRVARRLYHSRDLGEPFDFVTWFEFAPEHAPAFDELVAMLRGREEWSFVEREVDVRLRRDSLRSAPLG